MAKWRSQRAEGGAGWRQERPSSRASCQAASGISPVVRQARWELCQAICKGEQGVGGREVTDGCGAQQAHQAVLESAKAAFDFALGLRIGRDAVGNAQAEQRALELGADIVGAGVWRGAEEREAVGVVGARGAVSGDGGACATEVRPSRLVRDEATGDDFARVVVEGEDEDGFGSSRPPLMRGGIERSEKAKGRSLCPQGSAGGRWQSCCQSSPMEPVCQRRRGFGPGLGAGAASSGR